MKYFKYAAATVAFIGVLGGGAPAFAQMYYSGSPSMQYGTGYSYPSSSYQPMQNYGYQPMNYGQPANYVQQPINYASPVNYGGYPSYQVNVYPSTTQYANQYVSPSYSQPTYNSGQNGMTMPSYNTMPSNNYPQAAAASPLYFYGQASDFPTYSQTYGQSGQGNPYGNSYQNYGSGSYGNQNYGMTGQGGYNPSTSQNNLYGQGPSRPDYDPHTASWSNYYTQYPQVPHNYTGDSDLYGYPLCNWQGYGVAECNSDPNQWVYDPYSGTWY